MTQENCCSGNSNDKIDLTTIQVQNDSSCSCDSDCCGTPAPTPLQKTSQPSEFDITIDGKKIRVNDASKNIVEIAKTAGIAIPAPCFIAKKKKGCCKACVIEINNEQTYACSTNPTEGMNIVVNNNEDLKALRKERLLLYRDAIKSNTPIQCNGSSSCGGNE